MPWRDIARHAKVVHGTDASSLRTVTNQGLSDGAQSGPQRNEESYQNSFGLTLCSVTAALASLERSPRPANCTPGLRGTLFEILFGHVEVVTYTLVRKGGVKMSNSVMLEQTNLGVTVGFEIPDEDTEFNEDLRRRCELEARRNGFLVGYFDATILDPKSNELDHETLIR